MPKVLSLVVAAAIAAVPLSWFLSRWTDGDSGSSGTTWLVKLLLSGLLSSAVLMLVQLAWRMVTHFRAKRRAKQELVERKARLWNKLSGLGTPLTNCKTLCLEDYESLRGRIYKGELAPLDVLEAFQARTLMLDRGASRTSKVKEVVYDADVRAFLLDGNRASEVLMPAATFYYNAALAPFKERDGDGELNDQNHPLVTALRDEGAIDIGLVDKGIEQVSSLLLNHGAHFFAGQYPTSRLREVLRAISSKPVCAALLSRDQPPGRFLALLASQSRLPSLAAAAVTPGMRDHLVGGEQQPQPQQQRQRFRIGYLFVNQRPSQADGRAPPGDADTAKFLASAAADVVELVRGVFAAPDRLTAASAGGDSAGVRSQVEAALAEHKLDGLAVVLSGDHCRLIGQLAGFMDMSVFHLVDHLTELYLCHPHDRLRAGLAVAQAFGAAIRL